MKLQMKINSETQVIQEAEFKTFGCGSPIASSSLATEWVKGKTSRKRLPSRTRISSVSSDFPRATPLDATRYSRIRRRPHLVGSSIFYGSSSENPAVRVAPGALPAAVATTA